jgi:pseudaminic acid cytidylyltransferase
LLYIRNRAFSKPQFFKIGFQSPIEQKDKKIAFSVTSFPFSVQRALKQSGEGVIPMYHAHIAKRSQDLEEAYHDAGQFYWGENIGAFTK